uniref:Uncharacterized protein n=1 Tax=Rhizophora mucronata TaxID=61149 RepID=A0A2P2LIY5_RHIMU
MQNRNKTEDDIDHSDSDTEMIEKKLSLVLIQSMLERLLRTNRLSCLHLHHSKRMQMWTFI